MTRTRRPQIALASVLLAVIAVLALANRAGSQPALPEVDAAELLASVGTALHSDPSVSGDVALRADLGLPELPEDLLGDALGDAAPWTAVGADRRLRLERSADGLRLAELTDDGERALVRDAEDVWLWDSADMTAVHHRAPATPHPPPDAVDPLEAARRALDAVSETTAIQVGRSDRVAGRDVYTLQLAPRDEQTLVERVELAVDAEHRLPLRVAVWGSTDAPAVSIGFTRVSFAAIDPSRFDFTPPDGAEVTEAPAPPSFGDLPRAPGRDGIAPQRVGQGWSQVLAVPLPGPSHPPADAARDLLPFQGTLYSAAEATVDGTTYLLVGAVPLTQLEAAAGALR